MLFARSKRDEDEEFRRVGVLAYRKSVRRCQIDGGLYDEIMFDLFTV